MESHLDKGPPVMVSKERAEKYGALDVNWRYFKVVEHTRLEKAEASLAVAVEALDEIAFFAVDESIPYALAHEALARIEGEK
jgi:hypothetical protein